MINEPDMTLTQMLLVAGVIICALIMFMQVVPGN